jgi:cyclopropane fatty-acyl-phospholipid synthase-like methyltransferase
MHLLLPGQDYRGRKGRCLDRDIIRYYEESYWDYRTAWMDGKNLALHYGFWEPGIRTHSQALSNMNRVLADIAAIRPRETVLDAGCGIGGSAIWLAENHGATVTGISLSPAQVEQARRHARRRRLADRVRFEVADFCRTPFADGSFDVVWGLESVCHALDKSAFVEEAFRLLKPGGRLVCSDGYAMRREYTDSEWETIRTCLDGWQIPNLATPDEFTRYLQSAGFGAVCFRDVTVHILPSSQRLYRISRLTRPLQKIMAVLGLRTAAQSGNFYTALNQYRIFRDGLACYGIFRADKPGSVGVTA